MYVPVYRVGERKFFFAYQDQLFENKEQSDVRGKELEEFFFFEGSIEVCKERIMKMRTEHFLAYQVVFLDGVDLEKLKKKVRNRTKIA